MYLFIFFWSAALRSARSLAGMSGSPPFGLIFSCFMCAMMLGSIIFTLSVPSHGQLAGSRMLTMAMAGASCCLLMTVLSRDEKTIFWAFCLFETCVGIYFPSMAYLKGRTVEDGVRAKVYGILRLPLNVFVVVAHSLAEEGRQKRSSSVLPTVLIWHRRSAQRQRLPNMQRTPSRWLHSCAPVFE